MRAEARLQSPGGLKVHLCAAGRPACDLRPPSVELQKVAIADSAPNLAQVPYQTRCCT